jgi:hypothetical protein
MNTRYYLDTEFNSFGGSLISLGIVRHDDPNDCLYLVVPAADIERMTFEEGMDPWIERNIIPVLWDLPPNVGPIIIPVHEWGQHIADFIYRENEITQIIVDWPADAMDFCKLLMAGPGLAVAMPNQTHITILRHIDVYPTSVVGAVQHNALWDALAIRQLLIELEAKNEKPLPKSAIERLGRPMRHDAETQAAIQRVGDKFHETRDLHYPGLDPSDIHRILKAVGYYD